MDDAKAVNGVFDFSDDGARWSTSASGTDVITATTGYALASGDDFKGGKALEITDSRAGFYGTKIPVSRDRIYRVKARVKNNSFSGVTRIFLGVATFDGNGDLETALPGSHRYCTAINTAVPNDGEWHEFEGVITGGGNSTHNEFRPTTAFAAPMFIANYALPGQKTYIDYLSIEDITEAKAEADRVEQVAVDGDTALAGDISSLTTRMGTAEADIAAEETARVTQDTALANSITTLSADLDDTNATVTQQATAITDLEGYAAARYGIEVSAGGASAGVSLVAIDGTGSAIHVRAQDILLDGSVKVPQLSIEEGLILDEINAGFSLGKSSAADTADGIYLGRTPDNSGGVGFGFYVGRDVAGMEQSIKITKDTGLTIRNADFRIGAVTKSVHEYTGLDTTHTLTLDAGTETINLQIQQAGGVPQEDGEDTVVVLKDGATTIQTWTATGNDTGLTAVMTPYGNAGYGQLAGGADSGQDFGPSGAYLEISEYDVSGLTSPSLEITIGDGGDFGTGGGGFPGTQGACTVTQEGTGDQLASPVSVEPSVTGSFTMSSSGGSFPSLTPDTGLWVVTELYPGASITTGEGKTLTTKSQWTALTFISRGTPTYTSPANTAVNYLFYPMSG
ncbi:hypothetical protein [Roseovarius sp. E0-M6]|uniref:hypothetical protein n=1 Tax=Roseovarius sp. E0-M6 TaxID=3127118 RepID=UPI00300F7C56